MQAPVKQEDTPKLRLSMFGVGGYRAATDEIGWKGDWPDPNVTASEKPPVGLPPDSTPKSSCCGGGGGRKLAPKQAPSEAHRQPEETQQTRVQMAQRKLQESIIQGPLGLLPHQRSNDALIQSWPTANGPQPVISPFQTPMDRSQPNLNFHPSPMSMHQNGLNGDAHITCSCGDSCACLGCAEHPTNETTINYVRDATAHMLNFSTVFPSQNQFNMMNGHHCGSGQRSEFPPASFGPMYGNFSQGQFDGLQGVAPQGGMVNQQQAPMMNSMDPTMWHSMNMAGQPEGMRGSPKANGGVNGNANGSTHRPNGGEFEPDSANGFDEQLSPSLYSFGAFELHGCGEAQGACQCGSGCECVGCLTHTGHDSSGDLMATHNDAGSIETTVNGAFG
jgi:hypothetical protein